MANYFPDKVNQLVTLNQDLRQAAWDMVTGGDQPQEPQQAPSSPAAQAWAPMGPEWGSGWTRTLQQRGQLK